MGNIIKQLLRRTGFDVVRVPYPYTLNKHLQGLLPSLGVDCVLDVGAMHGQYARSLRSVGYTGLIISADPVPSNVEVMRNKAIGDAGWTVVQSALGEVPGELSLSVSKNSDLSSFLPLNAYGRSTFPEISKIVENIRVPVERLDAAAWIPETARRIFLKTDTQGFDVPVLRGADGLLDRIVLVQMELPLRPLYDGMADLTEGLSELRARGFDVNGFFPVKADSSGALIEVDCVAHRRDA